MENKATKIGIYDDCLNPFVYNLVPKNSACLDVGCWTGNVGRVLIKNFNCTVDGIDFNEVALEKAYETGYRNVYFIDLNARSIDLSKISEKYDCIIFADVLEHLTNPSTVLEAFKAKLEDSGIVIISVPNIAFILQRVLLFFGKFEYNPRGGIMDATHVRFFTISSIKELCVKSGYNVEICQGYSLVKDRYFFLRYLAQLFPGVFSVQILLRLSKKNE